MTADHALVLTSIAAALESDYVFPSVGAAAAGALRSRSAALAAAPSAGAFAAATTEVLQEVSGDLHLRLIHHPDGAPDSDDVQGHERYWREQARATAGGVRSVSRPDPGVAVVELGPFLGVPAYTASWIHAAMALVAGAERLLLDVRGCRGGTPDSVALLCSYLFGAEPVHLNDVHDRDGVRQLWTHSWLPGARLDEVPTAVLVSAETFSGGEEIAFLLQELSRAVVVGERTRGGAHPRVGVRVHPELELALPVARPRSPRTGANWEGVGVAPDVTCAPEQAVEAALAALG